MDKGMLKYFWNCGDSQIIEFALLRARLNRHEKEVLRLVLDECMTQEQAAEVLDLSTRKIQNIWATAATKLLSIEWVAAYACALKEKSRE